MISDCEMFVRWKSSHNASLNGCEMTFVRFPIHKLLTTHFWSQATFFLWVFCEMTSKTGSEKTLLPSSVPCGGSPRRMRSLWCVIFRFFMLFLGSECTLFSRPPHPILVQTLLQCMLQRTTELNDFTRQNRNVVLLYTFLTPELGTFYKNTKIDKMSQSLTFCDNLESSGSSPLPCLAELCGASFFSASESLHRPTTHPSPTPP